MAIVLLPLLPINLAIKILLAAAVLLSLLYYWRRDLLTLSAVEWSEPNGWAVIDQSGDRNPAALHGSSYLNRHLVILNFRLLDGSKRHLILTENAVGSDLFRWLRALLGQTNPVSSR